LGREIDLERKEMQAARESLEQLGENLTRGKLLDLVVSAPNQQRVKALTSLARPAMDYNFFQMFTELIENTDGEQRKKLVERRNAILKMTQEIDQAVNQRIDAGRTMIEKLLAEEDPARAVQQNLQLIDEYFVQALALEIEKAKQEENKERQQKLHELRQEIEELTTPPELKLLDDLLSAAENEETLQEKIAEHDDSLDNDFINYLSAIMNSYQENVNKSQGEEKEILEGNYQLLQKVYNAVLRRSMEKNMQE
jgi:RNase H-fold protein (predicted Holliday junction resolvase)